MSNPAWERMTGYTAAGRPSQHARHHASRGRRGSSVLRADDAGRTGAACFRKRYLRKNGEVLWARVHAVVVRGADGQARYRLAIIEDISAEKGAERRRTDLQQQQRQALVQDVHHRIKNNLQGVAGLLERHAAATPALGPAIDDAVGRLNALAMMHGLHSELSGREVNLCNIVRGIVDTLQTLSPVPLEYRLPDGFIPVEVARDESVPVALILNELVSNAIKHVDAAVGRAAVTIEVKRAAASALVGAQRAGLAAARIRSRSTGIWAWA